MNESHGYREKPTCARALHAPFLLFAAAVLAAPSTSQIDVTVLSQQQEFWGSPSGPSCVPFWDGAPSVPPAGAEIVSQFQFFCFSGPQGFHNVSVQSDGVGMTCQAPSSIIGNSVSRVHCIFEGYATGAFHISTSMGGASPWGTSTTIADVDIGLDGVDVSGVVGSTVIPAVLNGSTTVSVYCRASHDCVPGGCVLGASASASVTFVPDAAPAPAVLQSYGASCGATLSVVDAPGPGVHELELTVGGSVPDAFAVLAIGLEPAAVPIPLDPSCTLNTTILATGVLPTDAIGTAVFGLRMFAPVQGSIYVQGFPFDLASGQLESSPGVSVTFSD